MRFALALLLSLPAWAGTRIGFVQQSTPAANTILSQSSTTFTIKAANPTDLLFIFVVLKSTSATNASISSVSIANVTGGSSAGQFYGTTTTRRTMYSRIAYATGTGGTTLTVNFNSSYSGTVIATVAEFSGYALSIDGYNPATQSSTNTPSISTGVGGTDLGVTALNYASTAAVTTQPSGWTALTQVNDGVNMAIQVNYKFRVNGATASYVLPASVTCQGYGISNFMTVGLPAVY